MSMDPPSKSAKTEPAVSSAGLDWANLTFSLQETAGRAQCEYKDGAWGELSFETDPYLRVHAFANVLHYGQELFEGLKAFHCKDGAIRVFNDRANYERLQRGSRRMVIPEMSYDTWKSAIDLAISKNRAYIPPAENCAAGASLYLRPVVFGSGAQVGLGPSNAFTFMVLVVPVGPYFKTGFTAIPGHVITDFDRAAPAGVGAIKCGGNYAADTLPSSKHKKEGYPIGLYLDSIEKKYVEEFNGANMIVITKDGKYVTPQSDSILPSCTNICLIQLAKDKGMVVERRPMAFKEEVNDWAEVGAVGTAAVVCPIKSLTLGDEVFKFAEDAKVLQDLFQSLTRIQRGEEEDKHGWARAVAMD